MGSCGSASHWVSVVFLLLRSAHGDALHECALGENVEDDVSSKEEVKSISIDELVKSYQNNQDQ